MNEGKCPSEKLAVKLPETVKILSIRVSFFVFILVGTKIRWTRRLEVILSKKFDVSVWLEYLRRSKLRSPAIYIDFLVLLFSQNICDLGKFDISEVCGIHFRVSINYTNIVIAVFFVNYFNK